MAKSQARRISGFGPFRFDHEARLLFRDGAAVPLSPKALDILSVLIESDGELVKKNDLVQAVWPNTFVEESNLAHHISVLRKTLGEGGCGTTLYRDRSQARVSLRCLFEFCQARTFLSRSKLTGRRWMLAS